MTWSFHGHPGHKSAQAKINFAPEIFRCDYFVIALDSDWVPQINDKKQQIPHESIKMCFLKDFTIIFNIGKHARNTHFWLKNANYHYLNSAT